MQGSYRERPVRQPNIERRAGRRALITSTLVVAGAALLLAGTAILVPALTEHAPAPVAVGAPAAVPEPADTRPAPVVQAPTRPAVFEPPRLASKRVDAGQPLQVQIARLGLNAPITEVGVVNGLYVVPSRAAGHHTDSVAPGQPGRAILNGHIESLNAGRVFAALPRVEIGDHITVTGERGTTTWEVTSVARHDRYDRDWMIGDIEPSLVLYTCTGQWDWKTQDYLERLVVIATLVS